MKNPVLVICTLITCMILANSCKPDYSDVTLQTDRDTADYYRGLNMGAYLRNERFDGKFNYDAFLMGLEYATDTFIGSYEQALMEAYVDLHIENNKQITLEREFRRYKKENEDFLAENAKKDSVILLPGGIQYKVLKEGYGPKPGSSDRVTFHFSCHRIDGLLIESSFDAEPISYGINALLPGWREAVRNMPEGSRWEVVIPADQLYGSEPPENTDILPYSTLIYEIELIQIGD